MNSEPFRNCTAILFDYGGTLDSDGQHWLTRFLTLYEAAGLAIPRPEITRAFYHAVDTCYADSHVASIGLKPLIDYHVHLQFQALNIKDGSKEKQVAGQFYSDCRAFLQERQHLLSRMRTAYRLGIVSNFYGNLATVCDEAHLSELFEFIVDSNRVELRKPDPRIFLLALAQLGLTAGEVIFVGDSYERDMLPAIKTGMRAIWLRGQNGAANQGPETIPVDASIGRLSELEELLP